MMVYLCALKKSGGKKNVHITSFIHTLMWKYLYTYKKKVNTKHSLFNENISKPCFFSRYWIFGNKKKIFLKITWTWTRCSFLWKLELRNHYLFSTKVTPQNFCLLRGQGHNRNVHVYAVHILWTLISTRLFPFYYTYYRSWPLSLVYNKPMVHR